MLETLLNVTFLMLLFIFFCLIGFGGFWFGRVTAKPKDPHFVKLNVNKNYFVGLNYLLNDQNDKALSLLIKSLSVDSDTIETHLALGSLFRKRGELTRAIRIHQNLIARPNLTLAETNQALLALAYDYLAAGVLDRAEQTFWRVTEDPTYKNEAYLKLIDIYQRERRWLQAIDVAMRLSALGDKNIASALAHYHCELAEKALKLKNPQDALKELTLAKKHQRRLARIYLLQGDAYLALQDLKKALDAYQTVSEVDADYLSEATPKIVALFKQAKQPEALRLYLEQTHAKWPRVALILALADHYAKHQDSRSAIGFLKAEIDRQPSLKALLQWIHYEQAQPDLNSETQQQLAILHNLAVKLIEHKPIYRCDQCGFAGRILFWQCPGCKQWGSIKPIHGVEGDG